MRRGNEITMTHRYRLDPSRGNGSENRQTCEAPAMAAALDMIWHCCREPLSRDRV